MLHQALLGFISNELGVYIIYNFCKTGLDWFPISSTNGPPSFRLQSFNNEQSMENTKIESLERIEIVQSVKLLNSAQKGWFKGFVLS